MTDCHTDRVGRGRGGVGVGWKTKGVGGIKGCGFPGEGEAGGEGVTQTPKIFNNFFFRDISLLTV